MPQKSYLPIVCLVLVFFSTQVLANEKSEDLSQAVSQVETISLKKPPQILAKWYKPENKRQVWLHTMFRLRRQSLAIMDYAKENDALLLNKWFKDFKKDYLSIATMVPSWASLLDKNSLAELEQAVGEGNSLAISKSLKQLQQSCVQCHDDYQALAKLMFRTPSFANVKIKNSQTGKNRHYDEAMESVSQVVNRIKIAMHDKKYVRAASYLPPLKQHLDDFSNGCQDCHKKPQEQIDYIIRVSDPLLAELEQALSSQDNKKARIALGTFAVKTCARCHSIHRTTFDLQELMD